MGSGYFQALCECHQSSCSRISRVICEASREYIPYARIHRTAGRKVCCLHGRSHESRVQGRSPPIDSHAWHNIVLLNKQALFVSPRNSVEGQKHLFAQTDCRALFCPETFLPVVESWGLGSDMQVYKVGPLHDWFPTEEVPHFSYEKTFEQAEWEPLCVLHTSGSTGLPKPITARNVCEYPMYLRMHR